MGYVRVPIVELQEQEQKNPYGGYRVRYAGEAISFVKDVIGCDQDGYAIICAVDHDRRPVYVQTVEKEVLWDPTFQVEIYRRAVLSDAAGVFTIRIQKERITGLDARDLRCAARLSRLGKGLSIAFMDHIILGGGYHVSFWENDILPDIDLPEEMDKEQSLMGGPPILGPSALSGPIA